MKTWYKAVCDKHKEACNIFVDNPSMTELYLGERDKEIQTWLMKHYGCALRLIHDDYDLDDIFEANYEIENHKWKYIEK